MRGVREKGFVALESQNFYFSQTPGRLSQALFWMYKGFEINWKNYFKRPIETHLENNLLAVCTIPHRQFIFLLSLMYY